LYCKVGKDAEIITADNINKAAAETREYCKRGFPVYGAEFDKR